MEHILSDLQTESYWFAVVMSCIRIRFETLDVVDGDLVYKFVQTKRSKSSLGSQEAVSDNVSVCKFQSAV